MDNRIDTKLEAFDVEEFSTFLREEKGFSGEVTITAKPLRISSNEVVWLFALATYKVKGGGTQESYGYAWTTAADGRTPKKVERLCIQIEVAGEFSPPEPLCGDNIDKISTATRGVYSSLPQRVTAYAVSEGPHIEVTDSSDD